jgi:hypothetical protein
MSINKNTRVQMFFVQYILISTLLFSWYILRRIVAFILNCKLSYENNMNVSQLSHITRAHTHTVCSTQHPTQPILSSQKYIHRTDHHHDFPSKRSVWSHHSQWCREGDWVSIGFPQSFTQCLVSASTQSSGNFGRSSRQVLFTVALSRKLIIN